MTVWIVWRHYGTVGANVEAVYASEDAARAHADTVNKREGRKYLTVHELPVLTEPPADAASQ